jgi:type IV pilus assembly protein PilN
MRLNVNLATRPYEDLGRFLARWGTLTLLLAIATFGLTYYSVHTWRASRDVNKQIARMQGEMNKLDQDRAAAIATLNKPENKVIADQSKFLNNAIQRKSLSWTRIFMDLERIMPNQLHVLSITPEFNPQNQLLIHLRVGGESREKAIDLIRRMEESPTFRDAELHSETIAAKDTGRTDAVQFEITTVYVPVANESPAKAPEKTATLAKKGGTQ